MKKVFLILISVVFVFSLNFGFMFGGGGPTVYYIPGNSIIDPIGLNLKFENGILAFGGGGFGNLGNRWFIGGEGFGGELKKDLNGVTYTFEIGYGGMTVSSNIYILRSLIVHFGSGFGYFNEIISREIKASNTNDTIDDFKNGNVDSKAKISVSYVSLSPYIQLRLALSNTFEIFAGLKYFVGYLIQDWQFENGEDVKGIDADKLLNFYVIQGGFAFGF